MVLPGLVASFILVRPPYPSVAAVASALEKHRVHAARRSADNLTRVLSGEGDLGEPKTRPRYAANVVARPTRVPAIPSSTSSAPRRIKPQV